MDQNNEPTQQDVNDNALQDMTMTSEGVMEETVQDTATDAPEPPQSVMDVTAPPQDVVVAAPEPVAEEESVTEEINSPASPDFAAPEVVIPTGSDPIVAPESPNKKTGKGLLVAIAVVLALVLAAIAVLVFMKASNTTKSANKAGSNTSDQSKTAESTTKTPLTTKEVDTTVSEVDATLNALDETKDFAADTISDKALGLQ